MIKISIHANWFGFDPEKAREAILKYSPNEAGIWGDIQVVSDASAADFCICLQDKDLALGQVPFQKKILIRREPEAISPFVKDADRYLHVIDYENSYHYSFWRIEATYDELKRLEPPKDYNQGIYTVMSHKQKTQDQKLRTSFAAKCHDLFGMEIFGSFKDVLKGKLTTAHTSLNKFDIGYGRSYCFAPENSRLKNYFTEKIIDAYLGWNMPVYWGCPNILDYFPAESLHIIDMEDEHAIDHVREISQTPLSKTNLEAIRYARQLVLDQYSFFPFLKSHLEAIEPELDWWQNINHALHYWTTKSFRKLGELKSRYLSH